MKILLLSPHRENLIRFLELDGNEVINTEEKISLISEVVKDIDFVISYGYRHILKADLIRLFPNRMINIHTSFLPWNRGADPNLWSFLENTPKGVSIHYVDSGIDTGDILTQEEIYFAEDDTLRTSYCKLTETAFRLLEKYWYEIKNAKITSHPQSHKGSFHRLKDRKKYEHLLYKGWDTPVKDLIGKVLKS
jgi:methionyl-tRNA formyltransferase